MCNSSSTVCYGTENPTDDSFFAYQMAAAGNPHAAGNDVCALFSGYCRGGHKVLALKLIIERKSALEEINFSRAFKESCAGGQLDMAKLCLAIDPHSVDRHISYSLALEDCLFHTDNIPLIRWLIDIGQFDIETIRDLFPSACIGGYRNVIKMLIDDYDMDLEVINSGLRAACHEGNFDVVRWLIEEYGANDYDVALIRCCAMGHIEEAKWFVAEHGASEFNSALIATVQNQHTRIAKWLIEECGATAFDELFQRCVMFNRIRMAKWVIENYGGGDEYMDLQTAIETAIYRDYTELISLIRGKM